MLNNPLLKTVFNFVIAVAIAVPTVADGVHGATEWCVLMAAIANAVLVWWVPEMKDGAAKYAKSVVAITVALAAVIPSLAIDGWSSGDGYQIILLVLGALGTPLVPNKGYVYARKIAGPQSRH